MRTRHDRLDEMKAAFEVAKETFDSVYLLLFLFLAVCLFWAAPLRADIKNDTWGQDGAKFSNSDKTKLKQAIDKFSGLTLSTTSSGNLNLRDCGDCLKKMVDNDRICEEKGSIDAGASTYADDNAACRPTSDGINVSKTKLDFNVPEKLAAALAHEWCHTAQANATGTAKFEIPCYEVEIEVLKKLKDSAASANHKTRIQNRITQMESCLTNLKASLGTDAVIPPKTPAFGGTIFSNEDTTYGVFSDSPELFLGNGEVPLFAQPLDTVRPFDLAAVPDFLLVVDSTESQDLLIVGGLGGEDIGSLEVFLVDSSLQVTRGEPVELPDRHPFSLAFHRETGVLYVLDTRQSEILRFGVELTPVGTEGSLTAHLVFLGTYADAQTFPELADMLHIQLLAGGEGFDLVAAAADLRNVDFTVDPDLPRLFLLDENADGMAEEAVPGRLLDDVRITPGYPDPVVQGLTAVRLFATAGAGVEIYEVMGGGGLGALLGSTMVPPDSRFVQVPLVRPLVGGERILALDVTTPGLPEPVPVVVETCAPGPTALCLSDGRFRVEMDWATVGGTSGAGQAQGITDDTGYFWFFDEENVEVVVKVLDACPVNQHFWVFAGGLTNVEVELQVTDTTTGDEQVYRNPQLTAFQPIQDNRAFATCPQGDNLRATASVEVETRRAATEVRALLERTGGAPGGCEQDETTLCLSDGRFRVRAHWETPFGTSGPGTGVTLTDDTGYFWFFDPANVEVVLKVLKACPVNNRFWVFAGGLTNVEVELTVEDTLAMQTKVYRNPQGTPFQPILDVRAFETCP